jgi:hypothetical protein
MLRPKLFTPGETAISKVAMTGVGSVEPGPLEVGHIIPKQHTLLNVTDYNNVVILKTKAVIKPQK